MNGPMPGRGALFVGGVPTALLPELSFTHPTREAIGGVHREPRYFFVKVRGGLSLHGQVVTIAPFVP